jgi:hypothetical protein
MTDDSFETMSRLLQRHAPPSSPFSDLLNYYWYQGMLFATAAAGVGSALGAMGFAIAEVVLWLKFGEHITLSIMFLLTYNGIFFFPSTEWAGVNKIILFVIDSPLWLVLLATYFLSFAALACIQDGYREAVRRFRSEWGGGARVTD